MKSQTHMRWKGIIWAIFFDVLLILGGYLIIKLLFTLVKHATGG